MNKRTQITSYKKQQGLGLISAIFVITVLALITAGLASLMANSSTLHTQHILSIRAQSAAQSGLAIQQAKLDQGKSCASKAVTYTFQTQGLYECSAQLSCISESATGKVFITLKSDASCGSGFEKASQSLEKRFIKKQ